MQIVCRRHELLWSTALGQSNTRLLERYLLTPLKCEICSFIWPQKPRKWTNLVILGDRPDTQREMTHTGNMFLITSINVLVVSAVKPLYCCCYTVYCLSISNWKNCSACKGNVPNSLPPLRRSTQKKVRIDYTKRGNLITTTVTRSLLLLVLQVLIDFLWLVPYIKLMNHLDFIWTEF